MTTLRQGVVEALCSDKTVKVSLSYITHKYDKRIPRKTMLLVHDENNSAKLNNKVLIKQSTPKSKRKTWELVEILDKVEGSDK